MINRDNWGRKKIGIGLCAIGFLFLFLGVILFFDRGLLSLGNVAFITGLCMLLGVTKTGRFFFRKEKFVASACFFGGFFIIIYGWPFVGFCLEMYGIWKLFAAFLPNVIQAMKLVPGLGILLAIPPFSWGVDYISKSQQRLPV